ncbi:polyhydroxyalkanoic acid system family protein [Aquabacterium sp.]|uniref:polyhydroxyalkanoic acid system family protein n=1 Tax=Aquabacterium sp. TaxID=1872578 RepID=UPI0035B0881A
MADIHIRREHTLGLDKARELATQWIDGASKKMGLTCQHQPGDQQDLIKFERSGVEGQMVVSANAFELTAKLGMMMKPLKGMIEGEIDKNLQKLLERGAA